ncbi:hypothetical protein MKW98_011122 [Papaver atlanticum]|uniref:Uncharacterized protein n=1 Tax=Papaver atlanticum TaxID=357466 RepID=A0AAD4XV42_9MAGN|nr:hypothetical protein MKW98_011122 [Papaver atlanticum]
MRKQIILCDCRSLNSDHVANYKAEAKRRKLEIVKLHQEVTADIVNFEAKQYALYLKWLSYFDHRFDVADEISFKERFEFFKESARHVNQWKKSDMTDEEYGTHSWKTYPKKVNQVIAGIAHCLDN